MQYIFNTHRINSTICTLLTVCLASFDVRRLLIIFRLDTQDNKTICLFQVDGLLGQVKIIRLLNIGKLQYALFDMKQIWFINALQLITVSIALQPL